MKDLEACAIGLVVPSSYLFNITTPIPESLVSDATTMFIWDQNPFVINQMFGLFFYLFKRTFSIQIHSASFFNKAFKGAVNSCIFDIYI